VSHNPFSADKDRAQRLAALEGTMGPLIASSLAEAAAHGSHRPDLNAGGIVPAAIVAGLMAQHQLRTIEELMLLGLGAARALARPPISAFMVGAIGLERETGNLILGRNVEVPGTTLATTIHGEGFVMTRAAQRGTTIAAIALGEAHPCAHCRQYISEFAASRDMVLIDPLGHRLTMAELYPWPFDPGYLGETGFVPGATNNLRLAENSLEAPVAAALIQAGNLSWSPYSHCPGALVLTLADGQRVSGFAVESVAFNPGISPGQAALVALLAHGYEPDDIRSAALGTRLGGAVDYARSTAELLAQLSPSAQLDIVGWQV
jgi:cytidine deaminase